MFEKTVNKHISHAKKKNNHQSSLKLQNRALPLMSTWASQSESVPIFSHVKTTSFPLILTTEGEFLAHQAEEPISLYDDEASAIWESWYCCDYYFLYWDDECYSLTDNLQKLQQKVAWNAQEESVVLNRPIRKVAGYFTIRTCLWFQFHFMYIVLNQNNSCLKVIYILR